MNVSFSIGEVVNGFTITSRNGASEYLAENEVIILVFRTDSGEGRNYSQIQRMYDKTNGREYRAMRYLLRYVSTVQGFSNALYIKYKEVNSKYTIDGQTGEKIFEGDTCYYVENYGVYIATRADMIAFMLEKGYSIDEIQESSTDEFNTVYMTTFA